RRHTIRCTSACASGGVEETAGRRSGAPSAPPSPSEVAGPSWWEKLTGGASSVPPTKSEPPNHVALATPPAQPTPPKVKEPAAGTTPSRCAGMEITVGLNERRCFKPAAGKSEYFKDCEICPEMVVVPAGSFLMGSPASEPERSKDEVRVRVSIARPFAVGKYAVTFDDWDACVSDRGCNGYKPEDAGWGRGRYPVLYINWEDAKNYAVWLSRKSRKTYRLLSA